MTTIAAKPTLYNGIRFRSRLEARWAVFLNTLGFRGLTYEPEVPGFSGYLPDFEVPAAYVEVKPISWLKADTRQRHADLDKWASLVRHSQKALWVCLGEPGVWHNGKLETGTLVLLFTPESAMGSPRFRVAQWGECGVCGSINVADVKKPVCSHCPPVYEQITSAMHAVRDTSYVDAI